MKKVFAILVTVILLVSGMEISLDRHYCGDRLAAVKISFSGKMATCGMVQSCPVSSDHQGIHNRCCEDKLTFYNLSNKYYPEYFKLTEPATSFNFINTSLFNYTSGDQFKNQVSWVLPPGESFVTRLTQPEICVFRI
jgi:hypothetical protein